MKRKALAEIIVALLVLLFTYAAVTKLLDYSTFRLQLGRSPFITQFAGTVAWALPLGELLVALALVFKRTRLLGLYASLFLMTMFTAYIYAILNLSYYVPCSCGGVLSKMTWDQHLWFNIFFVGLSIGGIYFHLQVLKQDRKLSTSDPVFENYHFARI
jgi:hypothetical protein